jgi:hypothetical protein
MIKYKNKRKEANKKEVESEKKNRGFRRKVGKGRRMEVNQAKTIQIIIKIVRL